MHPDGYITEPQEFEALVGKSVYVTVPFDQNFGWTIPTMKFLARFRVEKSELSKPLYLNILYGPKFADRSYIHLNDDCSIDWGAGTTRQGHFFPNFWLAYAYALRTKTKDV